MINDPKTEQGSAGQPPSNQPSYDQREARETVQRVFGIKDPVTVEIMDRQGQIHLFALTGGYWWQKDRIGDVDKCCWYGPAPDGTPGKRLREFDMPGPRGQCAAM